MLGHSHRSGPIQVPPLAHKGLHEPEMGQFYTGKAVSKNLKWDNSIQVQPLAKKLKWDNSIQVPQLAHKGLYDPEMRQFYTGTAVSTQRVKPKIGQQFYTGTAVST